VRKLNVLGVILAFVGPAYGNVPTSLDEWGPIKFRMNLPEALEGGGRGAYEDRWGHVRFPVTADGMLFDAIVSFEGKGDHVASILLKEVNAPSRTEEECRKGAQGISEKIAKRYDTEPANEQENGLEKQLREITGREIQGFGLHKYYEYTFSNAAHIRIEMNIGIKADPRCFLEVEYIAPVFVSKQKF
jgi:hypothetical protein